MTRKWHIAFLLILVLFNSCSISDTTEKNVNQLVRQDKSQTFFEPLPQQQFYISWSVFTDSNTGGGFAHPIISPLEQSGTHEVIEIARKVNETILSVLELYAEDYIDDSYHDFQSRVVRFDDSWLSIQFGGETLTRARGLPATFALNFDIKSGELLTLCDVFEAELVLTSLGSGDFTQVLVASNVEDEVHLPIHLEDGFRNFRFLHFDVNRNFDFYFDNDNLYLIINVITTRHYVIYKISL